ncbi:MAG TPA: SCP2 sterol-binding domain-containing protein [Pseudomonadales bacterium]|nr:SCP2 sterol-binding domain-containing protein [Pseudomonadales bacterium]
MAKFLSDEWFREVEKLIEIAGDLEVPPALQTLAINISVSTDDGEVQMCMNGGRFEKGHTSTASTKLLLPASLARRLFIEGDQSAGMQGFMSGQIKIEGDMSKLMAMQTVQPSAKQRELQKQILAITE